MNGVFVSIKGRNGQFPVEASFSAEKGITALFGHSGAGKTTILKMLAGTLSPREGRIAIGPHVLFDSAQGINLPPEKRRIGYVFQDARLFPHLSVRRNLTYALWAGRRSPGRSFDEVVALLGIGHLLERKPSTLSGGERQRVAIGRALLSNPALLLFDEPLSSLDHNKRQEILPYIERLRDESGIPIIYVSHEVDEVARLADTLVVLSGGKLVAKGPAASVFSRTDLGAAFTRDEASALLEGHVTGIDAAYGVAFVDLHGHVFQVSQGGLAEGMDVRLRVRARDVSLARKAPSEISIRNILPVRVSSITNGDGPDAQVALNFGDQLIFARLTRKSIAELHLAAGDDVFALVKAVSTDRSSMRS
ncbi:MAG: molybdenum ABC transporter ATP-binding protein [Phyllobacterium sp.]